MNNIEKIIDILLDDKDLNLSVDQCEQIAELLDDNNIGDLQESKKEISSYRHIIDCLKENSHGNLDAQAKLADGARPNCRDVADTANMAANPDKDLNERLIDNIDYWIGSLWVKGYSPRSREVAKTLVELGLAATPHPADAAALEVTMWQLIAERLGEQLDIAEEKLKQAQDIVLKPTVDQEDKNHIITISLDDHYLDIMKRLADAIDNYDDWRIY